MKKTGLRDKDIILKAASLNFNEFLFIPAQTKKEQQKQYTVLHNLAKSYCNNVEPDIQLVVMKTFQDNRLWLKIAKYAVDADIFVKTVEGKVVPDTL